MFQQVPLGGAVPPDTPHAVSVSLPTWEDNIAYEEGQARVVKAMKSGYPRFFIHLSIQALAAEIVEAFAPAGADAVMLFPSKKTAEICQSFMVSRLSPEKGRKVKVVELAMPQKDAEELQITSGVWCVFYTKDDFPVAKQVWQHAGDGISSRRSEFLLKALKEGRLVQRQPPPSNLNFVQKGPRRYQRAASGPKIEKESTQHVQKHDRATHTTSTDGSELDHFIEERFGRNLDPALADKAKLAVRRRISGSLRDNSELHVALNAEPAEVRISGLSDDDVYLFPTGMSSIFNTHRGLMKARGQSKSICYGFPYTDTLKILQKWGPGAVFYPHASSEELDDLEERLTNGERFLALFTEFPGNPLLRSPDLKRIRGLADKYGFAVVVDESIGNFINVNVLPYADVVVSSLTKIFSGDSNVMGGSAVLNPNGKYYQLLKETWRTEYEDNYWAEDALVLERNSRDFVSRIYRINSNAQAVTKRLRQSPLVKDLYYPLYCHTKPHYDTCKHDEGGYGGLFSVVFHTPEQAKVFFDEIDVLKGPSLGTNFTLSSPFTILAHYAELDWAASCGVPAHLVRTAVGLEEESDLLARIDRALEAVEKVTGPN